MMHPTHRFLLISILLVGIIAGITYQTAEAAGIVLPRTKENPQVVARPVNNVVNEPKLPTVNVCGDITTNTTWTTGNVYVLTCNVNVQNGVTLTIQPGVVVKFNDFYRNLIVYGALIAQGAPDQMIYFTSLKDDAHGGDTNNDGNATIPNPSDWSSLYFMDSSSGSLLDYAWVGYGGGWQYANVMINFGQVTIRNSIVTRSGENGIYINSSSPVIEGNQIIHNIAHGIYAINSRAIIHHNLLSGNGSNGINNANADICLDARYNDWGDANGPHDPSAAVDACSQADHNNPAGASVSNHVWYYPWGSLPMFYLAAPFDDLYHGSELLRWGYNGVSNPSLYSANLHITRDGQIVMQRIAQPIRGEVRWDTTSAGDGIHQVQIILLDSSNQQIAEDTHQVLVNNSLVWHSGILIADETWQPGAIHAVEGELVVSTGISLTLETGTIVKFGPEGRLTLQDGAAMLAEGSALMPVILTSIRDDLAGGDSNLDGSDTSPAPGDWGGLNLLGSARLSTNQTEMRYLQTVHSGNLTQNETWLKGTLHIVNDNFTIQSGATLTIQPGVVVKIGYKKSLIINSGGQLLVQGTPAQPVIITSLRDDAQGGDTNRDGDSTLPAPGDWLSIYANGGTAFIDHARILYGGGSSSTAWNNSGMLRASGSGAMTVRGSWLQDAFFDAVLAQSGSFILENSIVVGADRGAVAWLSPMQINHCTFYDNRFGVLAHGGTPTIRNTIIANSLEYGVNWDLSSSYPPNVAYSDVWGSGLANFNNSVGQPNPTPGVNGILSADPLFRSPSSGAFQLSFGSPAIDAADGSLSPTQDAVGAPRYDDPRTPNTGIPTSSGAYADLGAYEFIENAVSDLDLVVLSVTGPTQVTAGEQATLIWTVANFGQGNVTGPWSDRISLVRDQTLFVGQVLVGGGLILSPGQQAEFSADINVPGGTPGDYRWQVEVNALGEVFEGANRSNNRGYSASITSLKVEELSLDGAALAGTFTSDRLEHWYSLDVPAGHAISVLLDRDGATGASELFLAHGRMPTPQDYDLRSAEWNSPDATSSLVTSQVETWHILAKALTLPGGDAGFTLAAQTMAFSVNSLLPASVGNSGPVTLQVQGGQLSSNLTYQLLGPGGETIAASRISVPDPTWAYPTFNLTGVPIGTYSLQVLQPGGGSQTLVDALQVKTGSGGKLHLTLSIPNTVRTGRPFEGQILYQNVGDADLIVPLVVLTANGNAEFRLNSSQAFTGTTDLQVLAISLQGPTGILRPGQRGLVTFQARTLQPGANYFSLSHKPADANDTPNWAALEAEMRPPGWEDSDWQAVWGDFTTLAGNTWGGYVQVLADYASLAAQQGFAAHDVAAVLGTAFQDLYDDRFANLRGHLVLENSTIPLANQMVLVLDSNGETVSAVRTYADGGFAFRLDDGLYRLDVPGYLIQGDGWINIPNQGQYPTIALIVSPGGRIAGWVTQNNTQQPLDEAVVSAVNTAGDSFVASVDENGRYVLAGLPSDVYNLTAVLRGWPQASLAGQSLSEGENLDGVDFRLFAPVGLEGQITASGSPLAGAALHLEDTRGNQAFSYTKADGSFSVGSLSPGLHSLLIRATGLADYTTQIELKAGITTTLPAIDLNLEASLHITLQDSGGQPVPNAAVVLIQEGEPIPLSMELSGSNGTLTFSGLAPGSYTVQVEHPDTWTLSNTVSLNAGGSHNLLFSLHDSGQISGQVLQGGQPLPEVIIQLVGEKSGQLVSWSDNNGNYSFTALPKDSYSIAVWGGRARQELVIDETAWQHNANFNLSGVKLSGSLTNASGSALSGKTVLLLRDGQVAATAETTEGGAYTFGAVANGTYVLRAGGGVGVSSALTVTVSGSSLSGLLIQTGSLSLSGLVSDSGGAPLANVTVQILPEGDLATAIQQSLQTTTSANGSYQLSNLAPGTYQVKAYSPGKAWHIQSVTLANPGPNTCHITLISGQALSGYVAAAADGTGIPGASVFVFDANSHQVIASAITAPDGSYLINDLPNGAYNLLASANGYQSLSLSSRMIQDKPLSLNFLLTPTDTSLAGRIAADGGGALYNALVSVRNASGEIIAYTFTGFDGNYQFYELPVGMYSLHVLATGFAPGQIGAVSLSNSGPPGNPGGIVNFSLNPAAVGTYPALAKVLQQIQAIPTSGTVIQGSIDANRLGREIYDYYQQNNPTPTRIPGDFDWGPETPIFKCLEAKPYYGWAWDNMNLKDQYYERWEVFYENYETTVFSSAKIFTARLLALAGSIASVKLGAAHYAVVATLYPTSLALANLGGIMDQVVSILSNPPAFNYSSITSLISSINDWLGAAAGVTASGYTLKDIYTALTQVNPSGATPALQAVANYIGVVSNVVSLLYETHESWSIFVNLAGSVPQARDDYYWSWKNFLKSRKMLAEANLWCEGKRDDLPPPPPNRYWNGGGGNNSIGSFDPNDKITTGFGSLGFVDAAMPILYTIHFENQSTATAPAQEVVITDQLDPNLDWSSLELVRIDFNEIELMIPPGRSQYETVTAVSSDPNPVRVQASLDPNSGLLTLRIASFDASTGVLPEDPFAGFLPPNDDEHRGEGYINFQVRPAANSSDGDAIHNQASIVFDINAPITTNIVTNTLDLRPPTSMVANLPATSPLTFTVSWSGDDGNGSGVAYYDVYVATNGGPFLPWQQSVTSNQSEFSGSVGFTYGFYVVATDNLGHCQETPTSAQASTTVLGEPLQRDIFLPLIAR